MTTCEDCSDDCKRRICCFHCGLLVCPWCWHHVHRCEPGHKRQDCTHLQVLQRQSSPARKKNILARMRAITLKRTENDGKQEADLRELGGPGDRAARATPQLLQ